MVYGFAPRAAVAVGWGYAGLCLGVGWLGAAFDLPPRAMGVSPFEHLPKMPGEAMAWTPFVVLLAIASLSTTAGLVGLRRRDIRTG